MKEKVFDSVRGDLNWKNLKNFRFWPKFSRALPPSSKKGPTDENIGISYLIVIIKFVFFKISTPILSFRKKMIPVSSQHRKIEIMRKIKNSSTAFICLGQELKSHSQSMELQVGNHSPFHEHTKFRQMVGKFSKSISCKKKYEIRMNTNEFQCFSVFYI